MKTRSEPRINRVFIGIFIGFPCKKEPMNTLILVLLALSGLVLGLFTALHGGLPPGPQDGRPRAPRTYPFVSLLKPVKDVDDDMAANLESFYRLDYPAYEILFAVDDFKDPCVGLLKDLQARYPRIPTTIVATGHPPFENPKIHKLARLESKSRGALFWATDSNVRVAPDYPPAGSSTNTSPTTPRSFSLRSGAPSSRTFGSLMENSGLNFFTSGSVIASWFLGRQPIVVGKSMLVERDGPGDIRRLRLLQGLPGRGLPHG